MSAEYFDRTGFDFLGYRISPHGLAVASGTVLKFVERMCRLYERGADTVRISNYVRRWLGWVRSGLGTSRFQLRHHIPLNETTVRPTRSKASGIADAIRRLQDPSHLKNSIRRR